MAPQQVRAASVCKDFQSYGDLCGWDARLLRLEARWMAPVKGIQRASRHFPTI